MKCVSKGMFSNVYFIGHVSKFFVFVKIFKRSKKYINNGYNLESLYKRDRLKTSVWGYCHFFKNHILRRYLPPKVYSLKYIPSLITISRLGNTINSAILLDLDDGKHLISKINQFTLDLRKATLFYNQEVPSFLKNNQIWKLKKELQIIKPLSYSVSKKKANILADKLGDCNYIAHGDLQPKNFIYDSGCLEIIDFEESFLAPKSWDEGFLWGNLLYLSVNNSLLSGVVLNYWNKLSKNNRN